MRTAAAAAEEDDDEDVDESLTEPPLGKQIEPCEAIEAEMPSFMPSHCTRFFPLSSSSGSSSPLAGSSTTITLFSADSGLAGVADDGTGRLQFARFQGFKASFFCAFRFRVKSRVRCQSQTSPSTV